MLRDVKENYMTKWDNHLRTEGKEFEMRERLCCNGTRGRHGKS